MGRYCFNKLPFGICSAPEVFQRRMNEILADLPGVVCQIDDILVFGSTQEEHDTNLEKVLKRIEKAHVTLSKEKCEYNLHLQDYHHILRTRGWCQSRPKENGSNFKNGPSNQHVGTSKIPRNGEPTGKILV